MPVFDDRKSTIGTGVISPLRVPHAQEASERIEHRVLSLLGFTQTRNKEQDAHEGGLPD